MHMRDSGCGGTVGRVIEITVLTISEDNMQNVK